MERQAIGNLEIDFKKDNPKHLRITWKQQKEKL